MANEFKIKNGFRSEGNSEITGSLIVSNSLDTAQGKLYYANGTSSINYKSGLLYDDFGVLSADYRDTRELFDSVESSSLNWQNRQLIKTDGTVSVDWENATFTGSFTGSFTGDGSGLTGISTYIDNLVTVGLPGSDTDFNSIKSAVDSILDASATNTYTVRVSPGIYIEDEMIVPSYVAVKGDSSISTVVSASNPSASIFIMSDQSMVIDMQIQGSTAPSASAIVYSSPTTPQTNAIAYVENVRFGTNYTNAKVVGTGSNGNCILQCSNVKYGGFTEGTKSFDVGFYVTRTGSAGIGRMQLRNVTSTNGGVAGSDNNQIFALSDAPGCAFIVNGCLLTRAAGTATGTAFKVYNGGNLRLTGVNFQRWDKGIWAPQTGSGPSIDAIALNFENCTTDVLIENTGSTGKIQGTDNFLKTQINLSASLYEVGQDPRIISVATKGGDFTSISASVAYITDSAANNRYVIQVGPGQFIEKEIDLTGKPYVSIVGSSIQTTQIFPSSSNQHLIKMGINNEVSFLSLTNSPAGYSALYVDDVGDYAQAHKVSFYDCDTCLTVISRTQDTKFYGEYLDYNGVYSTGSFVSSSNGFQALASLENYYQFPVAATGLIANYGTGNVAELDIYAAGLIGEGDATSVAIRLENGADLQGLGMDIPSWGTAVYIPNLANSASFNMVGSMIHDSVNYDFEILHPSSSCRFQGTADHSKISNVSSNFFWTFLDENDGELDITRKLSVTFADGTHTDASTLIFEGSPMGVMSGGNITISSSLTITTAAGYGYLHNMGTEVFQRIDWTNSNLTLSPNTDNYIFIDDTATLTSSPTQPDSAHNIILGRVVTNDTGIELIDNSPYFAAHMSNALSKFNRNALGPVFADGCIVSEDVTPFQLDVTAGLYYFGENEYDPTGGSAITFTQYYQSGSGAFGWNKSSQTVVPNNVYNSGSALIAMSSSYYTKHSLYTVGKGPDEEYFLVINQNQYATLVEAENAGLPFPPTYFSDGVVALASIYVQSGSANITQIQDIRPIIGFRAAGVNASSVHGNLLGLNADDHQQYLLVNGTRAMAGNLNMGGYNITNAISISSSFTGSLLGTASYVAAAGNNNEIQYNSNGSFASTASFAFIHASESLQQGSSVIASGSYSHAEGASTVAVGEASHAEGLGTQTIGNYSHAEGDGTQAIGFASHAEGSSAIASGAHSHAEGRGAIALGQYSHAEGNETIASGSYQHVSGKYNTHGNTTSLFIIGNGVNTSTRSDLALFNVDGIVFNQPVTASIVSASFIGNLTGTASYATQALSASWAPSGITIDNNVDDYLVTATGINKLNGETNLRFDGTTLKVTGNIQASSISGSLTGSLVGTASTASFVTASNVYGPYGSNSVISASFALSASWAPGSGGGATFVGGTNVDNRIITSTGTTPELNGEANLTFNGSTLAVTGNVTANSFTGSLQGTATTASYVSNSVSASYASTASYVNGIIIKNNAVAGGSFAGNPKKATVTFATAFPNTNYSVTVTGEDARSWTIESKLAGSFVINSNSNTALANNVYWQAISYGEFNG